MTQLESLLKLKTTPASKRCIPRTVKATTHAVDQVAVLAIIDDVAAKVLIVR